MPGLVAVLPTIPVRVGDSWRIPRKAVQTMLGEPELRGDSLHGKFVEIRREENGQARQAVISINGYNRLSIAFRQPVAEPAAGVSAAVPVRRLAAS